MTVPARRRIGPIDVDALTSQQAIARIIAAVAGREPLTVTFCNAHSVNMARTDPDFAAAYHGTLTLNDGIGVDLASRLLYGERFPENLNGTDLTPAVLAALPEETPVFLLGSKPGVADKAAEAIAATFPHARVVGTQDGYFTASDNPAIVARIVDSGARIILIAMGHPRQERWAAANRGGNDAVMLCIGAWLDFVSGTVPRAPAWVRRTRFEWAYRLAVEPRRMFGRYVIGNATFLIAALRQRLRAR